MPKYTLYDRGKLINKDDVKDYIYINYIPEEFEEQVQANYDEEDDIIGRSAPFVSYRSTGARQLTLELHFFAEEDAQIEVVDRVNWLKSFCYPDYDAALMKPPKMLKLMIGKGFINWTGIIKECPINYKAPYDVWTGLPSYATVSLNFQEVVSIPPGYDKFKPGMIKRRERNPAWGGSYRRSF